MMGTGPMLAQARGVRNVDEMHVLPFAKMWIAWLKLTLLSALLEGGLLCLLVTDHCEGWKVRREFRKKTEGNDYER